ncbi:hypothetical protein FS842_002510 [Serendipita sp. 407]|nr:hypothetical protein FS842_002510 [Serendipita sp. 407]
MVRRPDLQVVEDPHHCHYRLWWLRYPAVSSALDSKSNLHLHFWVFSYACGTCFVRQAFSSIDTPPWSRPSRGGECTSAARVGLSHQLSKIGFSLGSFAGWYTSIPMAATVFGGLLLNWITILL